MLQEGAQETGRDDNKRAEDVESEDEGWQTVSHSHKTIEENTNNNNKDANKEVDSNEQKQMVQQIPVVRYDT